MAVPRGHGNGTHWPVPAARLPRATSSSWRLRLKCQMRILWAGVDDSSGAMRNWPTRPRCILSVATVCGSTRWMANDFWMSTTMFRTSGTLTRGLSTRCVPRLVGLLATRVILMK